MQTPSRGAVPDPELPQDWLRPGSHLTASQLLPLPVLPSPFFSLILIFYLKLCFYTLCFQTSTLISHSGSTGHVNWRHYPTCPCWADYSGHAKRFSKAYVCPRMGVKTRRPVACHMGKVPTAPCSGVYKDIPLKRDRCSLLCLHFATKKKMQCGNSLWFLVVRYTTFGHDVPIHLLSDP